MNPHFQIIIIRPDQRIAKIPCIFCKYIITGFKAQRSNILNEKHCRSSGISFCKSMDLPQSGDKYRQVPDHFLYAQSLVAKCFFFRKIIFQRCPEFRSTPIYYRCSIQHPFFFCNIVIPDLTCMFIDSGKKLSMNRQIFIRCKAKGSLRQNLRNSHRNLVCFLRSVIPILLRVFPIITI